MPITACITGMHRSGTSMVAHSLNLAGVYLGPDDELLPPSHDNPEGFMENINFLLLNEKILSQLNAGWDFLPPLLDNWHCQPEFDPLYAEAKALTARFNHQPVWGWKDPRNLPAAPFWQAVLPGLKFIVCLRNPVEVIHSLQRRNYFSGAAGWQLWTVYNQRVLAIPPHQRIITHYDAWFFDPEQELQRVLDFIGITASSAAIEAACAVVNPKLRNNTIAGIPDEVNAPPAARELYTDLCAAAGSVYQAFVAQTDSMAATLTLDETLPVFEGFNYRQQISRLETENSEQRRLIEQLWQTTHALEADVAARDNQIKRLELEQYERDSRIVHLEQTLLQVQSQLDGILQSWSWRVVGPLRRLNWIKTRLIKPIYWLFTGQLQQKLAARNEAKILLASGLFDSEYYLKICPQVAAAGISPARHYVEYGIAQGLDPHPLFDTSFYLLQAAMVGNPLKHYLERGAAEGRNPHPLFDTSYYLKHNPDVAAAGVNPLKHYLNNGAAEGRNPNPTFNTTAYLREHPEVGDTGMNPLVHYVLTRTDTRAGSLLKAAGDQSYADWVMFYDTMTADDMRRMGQEIDEFEVQPLISIIMPVYNTPEPYLRAAIESVQSQIYERWELIISDDASDKAHVARVLREYAGQEPRIKVIYRQQNGHIAAATNDALKIAAGEWLSFLDHDDELRPHTLFEVVKAINAQANIDVIYSDSDKFSADGHRCEPFFKPDWSPEYFRGVMYVGHFLVVRAAVLVKAGLCRAEFNGVQDYELLLRISELTQAIYHIPKILYHWRKSPVSVAQSADAKPHLPQLQVAAVNAHLDRLNLPAYAQPYGDSHRVRIRPKPQTHYPKISILIPTKDNGAYLQAALTSIFEKTTYPDFEVIVTDNQSTQPETQAVLNAFPVEVIKYDAPFNFSAINNQMVQASRGDFVLFLNVDTEVITPWWLEELLYYAAQPDVGAVGALLLYPDNTVQHAGVVLGCRGTADHLMRGFPMDSDGYNGSLRVAREVTAVTAACMMVEKSRFNTVGGFNEHYAVIYQDVDLCLLLRRHRLRNILVPSVSLYHHESKIRGSAYNLLDRMLFLDRWEDWIKRGDEYYNPNFDPQHLDYRLELLRIKP
ncbi:MAG: hypothetical protein FOGNACKC_00096 [Anaerolineae bacterium]|nr:hypothetical protein [Anaerolineae bacterium]